MKLICLVIAAIFFSCRTLPKERDTQICNEGGFYQKIENVSFDDTARIRTLNGRFIKIRGIFYNNFEDVALYPSKSSSSPELALWLNLTMPDSLVNRFNKKQISVIGRINIQRKGHLNGYLATLDSVFCLMEVAN